ncbi:MAG: hypothetical protein RLZZ156_2428 [Deinococcota bacterium]
MEVIGHLVRWQPVIAREEKMQLQNRLRGCVGSENHPLFNCEVNPLYRSQNSDDVLFQMCSSGQLARVHLTTQLETNPIYPDTVLFGTLREWLQFELDDVMYLLEDAEIKL